MLYPADCRVVAIIPAYNEERFIGSVVLQVQEFANQVIVVDDGSADATARVAEAAGADVVRHCHNQGKGVALSSGFRRARELAPDVVITIDADGQHEAGEVDQVIAPVMAGEADIVIGSRYLDDNSDVPRHRIWGHHAFNFLTNQVSGVNATDSQSGFRAFSPRALQAIAFQSNGFSSNGFSVESEMQFLAKEHDLRLCEVPITICYHDPPKRSVIRHGLMVLNGILRLTGQYRPLLFFGLPGLLAMLGGLGLGLWVTETYKQSLNLAVGYALISVLLFITGSISLSTGVILHSVRALLIEYLNTEETTSWQSKN
jgi:glycosyltransferase involved in cell wall biosynthesis